MIRFRFLILAFWLALAGALFFFAPRLADVADYSNQGFLPDDADSKKAEELLKTITKDKLGETSLSIVLSRETGLSEADKSYGLELVSYLRRNIAGAPLTSTDNQPSAAPDDGHPIVKVTAPWDGSEQEESLIGAGGKTAIIVVYLSQSSYSNQVQRTVSALRDVIGVDQAGNPVAPGSASGGGSHTGTTASPGTPEFKGDKPGVPAGLERHITGEAGFSGDEHRMVNASMDIITPLTVVIVLLVLIVIFRSPVTPILPLAVIGLSFLISRGLIALLSGLGFPVSAYTETFMVAVLFGAGTDYCLLIVSRFREELHAVGRLRHAAAVEGAHGASPTPEEKAREKAAVSEALRKAIKGTTPAIVSSGGTVIVGFLCMGLAQFGLFNSTGPAVAIGVGVCLLMVLSLTPALVSIVGEGLFWPRKPTARRKKDDERSPFWDRLAIFITKRPIAILLVCLALFAPFAISSLTAVRSFDQISELPDESDSIKGFNLIKRDFKQGEVLPLKLSVKADSTLLTNEYLAQIERLSADIAKLDGVDAVRGPTRPAGDGWSTIVDRAHTEADEALDKAVADATRGMVAQQASAVEKAVRERAPALPQASDYLGYLDLSTELEDAVRGYLSTDTSGFYLDIVLSNSPYTNESLDVVAEIKDRAAFSLKGGPLADAAVEVGGPTAMFADVRDITAQDFVVVMLTVLLGIFIVLAALLRSLIAPIYLLLTILLSYVSTMGITALFFQGILGYAGVNWAVPFFSFCVLVALGIDYNIFLMSRVREEYRPGDTAGTVARALAETGKIITSCGIIMAGTFSAMMVSPVRSIIEVGFATVVGLLLDTFIVRSFIVPALAVKIGEFNWWPGRKVRVSSEARQSRKALKQTEPAN